MKIEFDNKNEVKLIHDAIMEAKFPDHPEDMSLYGSPFLASASKKILEELIDDAEKNDPKLVEMWLNWKTLTPERREWNIIKKILNKTETPKNFTELDKNNYLENVLAPFETDESDFRKLLSHL